MSYTFQWTRATSFIPEMLVGAAITLETAALSMVLGTAVAIPLALCRDSENRFLRTLSAGWVEISRNTPALFQIYMIYFGLGSLGIRVDSYPSLVLGIAFVNAGYLTEVLRGGLRAIPDTQLRAARSLGMSAGSVFIYITLPQLLRVTFYPITNQMVWSILMTSLGVVVGVTSDLMGVTQQLNVVSFRTFELFAIAAIIYYALAKGVTVGARLLAARLFRY